MAEKYSYEEIYSELTKILVSEFEAKEENLKPEADLFEDLEFDSIDAVDLVVRLQQFVNKKISPDDFKQIRTLNDVVIAIQNLL